jgi:hypothetical protein
MQKECNVEGKYNIGCPFGKAVIERVIKYWLCIYNKDYVEKVCNPCRTKVMLGVKLM